VVSTQLSRESGIEIPATMRAAVLVEPGRFEIREVSVPEPGPGEVLIKLQGCGVCASNIPPFEGRDWFEYPMEPGKLGHEGWGVIVAQASSLYPGATGPELESESHASPSPARSGSLSSPPEGRGLGLGDRVAFLSNHAYAEYDVAPVGAVVKIPDDIEAFPGEPLGCAMNIYKRSGVQAGDTVAIVGIGFLGSLLTRLCSQAGARVISIARKESALETARRMGAAETVPMHDHQAIIDQVKLLTDGKFCDVVIECVGKQWPLDLSAELTKERGRLVIAGFHQDGPRQVNMFLWNWRGLDVINAHEREEAVYIQGIEDAVRAVESGMIDPAPLFTHRFSLDQITTALEMTRERPEGFMKALILMEAK
jgi:threonine dehydrogenase-like Zn-dependent dehydrogenase